MKKGTTMTEDANIPTKDVPQPDDNGADDSSNVSQRGQRKKHRYKNKKDTFKGETQEMYGNVFQTLTKSTTGDSSRR